MAAGKRGRRSPHARSLQVALMVDIIREDEGEALDYPAMPDGLSDAALSIEPAAVWQRIESWITHRYGERTVEWITRGPGVFVPRLKPASKKYTAQQATKTLSSRAENKKSSNSYDCTTRGN